VEVTHYDDLVAAPERARARLESKDYVVRDGDILHVRTDH